MTALCYAGKDHCVPKIHVRNDQRPGLLLTLMLAPTGSGSSRCYLHDIHMVVYLQCHVSVAVSGVVFQELQESWWS